jgi:small subunit ribosomal protein S16
MQRTGRRGHAMFRVIVQDSHRSPTSGKVVAFLGSYDPHTKSRYFS